MLKSFEHEAILISLESLSLVRKNQLKLSGHLIAMNPYTSGILLEAGLANYCLPKFSEHPTWKGVYDQSSETIAAATHPDWLNFTIAETGVYSFYENAFGRLYSKLKFKRCGLSLQFEPIPYQSMMAQILEQYQIQFEQMA